MLNLVGPRFHQILAEETGHVAVREVALLMISDRFNDRRVKLLQDTSASLNRQIDLTQDALDSRAVQSRHVLCALSIRSAARPAVCVSFGVTLFLWFQRPFFQR